MAGTGKIENPWDAATGVSKGQKWSNLKTNEIAVIDAVSSLDGQIDVTYTDFFGQDHTDITTFLHGWEQVKKTEASPQIAQKTETSPQTALQLTNKEGQVVCFIRIENGVEKVCFSNDVSINELSNVTELLNKKKFRKQLAKEKFDKAQEFLNRKFS